LEFPFSSYFHPWEYRYFGRLLKYGLSIFEIIKREDPDILHANWAIPEGFATMLANARIKKPMIVSVQGYDVQCDTARGYGALSRTYTKDLVMKALKKADIITTHNNFHFETVLKIVGEKQKNKIVQIPLAVDINCFNPNIDGGIVREEYGIESDQKVILCVRRLRPIYGIEYLIEATSKVIKKYPRTVLMLVGDGENRGSLQKLVNDLGLNQNIFFTGWISRDKLPLFYAACDIYCDPCTFGQGINTLEAWACGKPVIGFKVGQVRIKDGQDGFLIKPFDIGELSDRILLLIGHSELIMEMGLIGRKRVEAEHSSKKWVDEIINLYQRISG
jgi:glycosyltransferase involved in cell wall biosynthesis